MPLKETIESVVRNLRQGRYPNEQAISFMVVGPILADLGWDTKNPDCVWPEYTVKNGRVDYALCFPSQHPKVFVEVKQPGRADGADEQLFEYALRHGIRMALLTDGHTWSFYLPGEEGSYEDRRVYKLDLLERTAEESAAILVRYLEQPRIANDSAIEAAVRELRDRGRRSLAVKTMATAWAALVEDEDTAITERLSSEVEAKCGVRPTIDDITKFLKQLKPMGAGEVQPRRPIPTSTPAATQHVGRTLGYTIRGQWHACRSGKEVMLGLLKEFAARDSAFCERCYRDEGNRGRSRIYISQNRYEIYQKEPSFCEKHSVEFTPDWFVATNLSDDAMDKVIRMGCRVAGVTLNVDVSYNLD